MATRVLVIESSGNLWGSERALLDLLDHLQDVDVAVCCPPDRPLDAELDRRGVRRLPYYVYALHEKGRLQRLRAALGVVRACLAFRPDVIYLNQSGAYKVVLPAATLLGLPIIAHVRIFEDAEYLARQAPDPRRLAGVIAISEAVESEVRVHAALSDIPLHRIYDAYALQAAEATGERARRIACVGRLAPVKGQDVLVAALPMVAAAECLFAGDGEAAFVESLKATPGVEKARWLGVVGDVDGLLASCQVLACPSRREPLGRVIFEAWDAGCVPVVFAGSGGAAEVVAAADGGVLYEPQTPEALAAALNCALDLPLAETHRLVANGRAWMAANVDAGQYGARVSDIFARAGRRAA